MRHLLLPLLFCALSTVSIAHKILVFSPTISASHMISNGRIADELAKAGHDVVLFEPDLLNMWHRVKNAKLARKWPVFGFSDKLSKAVSGFSSAFDDESTITYTGNMISYSKAFTAQCGVEELEKLKAENFDAFFGEQLNGCGHGLAEYLGIKRKFWISSCPIMDHMSWIIGLPHSLSYLPSVGNVDFGDRPNFYQRFQNIVEYLASQVGFGYDAHYGPLDAEFQKRFGPDFPSITSIERSPDVIFVSTDELIDLPRPIFPNIIHIGGLGMEDGAVKPLDEQFTLEMEEGKEGVVFFSFGSNVNTSQLPAEVMKTLFDVFKTFPDHHFIAKIDRYDKVSPTFAAGATNVFLTEWAPQSTLLRHPRLQCMIAHGGYNSITEAAHAGKPMITIPFFVDQFRNGRVLEKNGWGIPVRRQDLLAGGQKLKAALQEMLNDTKYSEGALRIPAMLKTKPFSASEKLLKWTDFAIASGGLPELKTPAGELSIIVYYNLDIFACILVFSMFLLYILLSVTSQMSSHSGSDYLKLAGLVAGGLAVGYFVGTFVGRKNARANRMIKLDCEKVVDTIDLSEIQRKPNGQWRTFCRCWKSKNWPYCDNAHKEHNSRCGDNVAQLRILESKK
ncbi:unnamed protein product, partial [Mesorhabditis spiculigera]